MNKTIGAVCLFAGLLAGPASALDAGYRATYYVASPDGQPLAASGVKRIDRVLDFNFVAAPPPLATKTDFMVHWEGQVVPKHNEQYTFYTNSDDGIRVKLDGVVIIDNWTYHGQTWNWAFVTLAAGRSYKVEVDYFQGSGDALVQFYWGSRSQQTELVPATPALAATVGPVVHYDRESPVGSGQYLTSHGDTFYGAWRGDGSLFLLTDDTKGFDWNLHDVATGNQNAGRNVTVNTLSSSPGDPDFRGQRIEGEHQALGFFRGENEGDPTLPRGGIWKGSGLGSYDGVLYLTVNDQTRAPDQKVIATGGSIMKSVDGGQNWIGPDQTVNKRPLPFMFDDPRFSRIAFVQYGQDGASPDNADDSRNYVYAISNSGEWENGSSVYLGRVLRSLLPQLRAGDWQFFAGLVNGTAQWGSLSGTVPVFEKSGTVSQTQMVYVPALRKYLLPNWFYVRSAGLQPSSPDYYGLASSGHTRWEFFAADHPWGPWNPAAPFYSKDWPTTGYYNPSIPNKFMSGTSMWLLFSGNYWDGSMYRLHYQHMDIDPAGSGVATPVDSRSFGAGTRTTR